MGYDQGEGMTIPMIERFVVETIIMLVWLLRIVVLVQIFAILNDIAEGVQNMLISRVIQIVLILSVMNPLYAQVDSLTSLLSTTEGDAKIAIHFELIRGLMFNDPPHASKHTEAALELALQSETDSLLTEAYHFAGLVNYFSSKWRISIDFYKKALSSDWGLISESYQARGFNNIAICYEKIGEYDLATDNYLKSMQLEKEHGNALGAAQTLLNLGILQYSNLKTDLAKKYLLQALPVLVEYEDKRSQVGCYQNLAAVERSLGNRSAALAYLDSTSILIDDIGYAAQYASLYHDYAHACFSTTDYHEALKYYQMAATHRDTSWQLPNYYGDLVGQGKSYFYLGQWEKGEKLLLEAQKNLASPEYQTFQIEIAHNLTYLYAEHGDGVRFKDAFDRFVELNENIRGQNVLSTIEELNVIYETAQKESEIRAAHQLINTQRTKFIFTVLLAIVILAGLITALVLRQKLQSSYEDLFQSNKELTQRWLHLQKFFSINATNGIGGETLFSRIMSTMSDEKFYLEADPSLDALVKKLNSNRTYVSQSISRNTEMNFSSFVNTFRVEEAKRIMADDSSKTWSLEAIAEKSGFKNRISFFQAFKKVTGLSPAIFMKKINRH